MTAGAILLLGGRSTRMGTAKADLDWHGEPLAAHVARVLQSAVGNGPVVAVGAPEQAIPQLPPGVTIVRDTIADEGPLRGFETGLVAIGTTADVVFVASVDAPLLHAGFITALLDALAPEDDAIVPIAHGHRHPLTAVYRVGVLPIITQALAAGDRGPGVILGRLGTRFLDETALLALPGVAMADPELDALQNVNTPEEFAATLLRARDDRA